MLITVALASARLKMQKGSTKVQKEAIAKAAKDQLNSVRTDLDSLLASIGNGSIYYPGRLKDSSKLVEVENFEESNLIVLDIDNTNPEAPPLSWSDALEHPYVIANAAFLHESPNYSTEQNRYRIGFILPEAITDYYVWKEVAARIAAHFPAQYDLVLRPTWGYKGCRSINVAGKRTQVISRTEFDRLTEGILEERERRRQHRREAQERYTPITFEEAEAILSFIPAQLSYGEWQSIVFALANSFEEHEAIQLIEGWSPGRDRHYLKLIRQNRRRKHAGATVVTMGTVIQLAKQHGYITPAREKQPPMEALQYDRTITVGRWVSDAAAELFSIIEQNPRTALISRTGNGKSKFVELLARRGSVLLISPLAKLAEQQSSEFESVGAVSVTGGETPEIADAYFQYRDFVCTTPEMLAQYMNCVERFDYVVIDEMHELRRINYRPAALAAFADALQRAQRVVGLTATLTDNIFRADGFYIVRIDDCRSDRLKIQVREFRGGAADPDKNNVTALVSRLIRDHVATGFHDSDNSDFLPAFSAENQPGNPQQKEQPGVLVIRLQNKKQLRVVRDYCRSTLQLTENTVAVLTSDNKNSSSVFSSVVQKRTIPAGVRVVLTTSVFDLGLNVLNRNIGRLVLIEPKDETEVIQFSARFRNAQVPVECWFPYRSADNRSNDNEQKTPANRWPVDMLGRYRRDYAQAGDICTVLNIAAQPGNKNLYNRVSAIGKYRFIQRVATAYKPNALYIAAHAYKEHTTALLTKPGRFFDVLAEHYPYCDIERLPVLDLDADADLEQIQEAIKQTEQSIDNELYRCLKEEPTCFFVNVFHAHSADRDLRKQLLREEFEGIRPPEDEASRALKNKYRELFAENIFLRLLARTLTKRYLYLRRLLLSAQEAVRIADTHRTPEAWHNLTVEFETMRRQYLLDHNPEALSSKWRKEAEAVRAVADTLQQKGEILTSDVLGAVNKVMHPRLFAMKKRESAKLIRILFGAFKRRGRQKITYYDCRSKRTFEDTLRSLQIDPAAYLQAWHITTTTAPPTDQQTVVCSLVGVDSE